MEDFPDHLENKSLPAYLKARNSGLGFFRLQWNKLRTVRSYNRVMSFKHLRTKEDHVKAALQFEANISQSAEPIVKASGIWSLERLAREARDIEKGAYLLNDPRLERYRNIFHVSWGMDHIADTGFDYSLFSNGMEGTIDPKYRLLVFEGAGTIAVASSRPLIASMIGIRIPRVFRNEDLKRFSRDLERREMQMFSHGFGRGLYFQAPTLRAALKRALSVPVFFHSGFAVQGVGFAFGMVNCEAPHEVFRAAERLERNNPGRIETDFFKDGIITAMSFLEWNFPGALESLEESDFTQKAWLRFRAYQDAGGVFSLGQSGAFQGN